MKSFIQNERPPGKGVWRRASWRRRGRREEKLARGALAPLRAPRNLRPGWRERCGPRRGPATWLRLPGEPVAPFAVERTGAAVRSRCATCGVQPPHAAQRRAAVTDNAGSGSAHWPCWCPVEEEIRCESRGTRGAAASGAKGRGTAPAASPGRGWDLGLQ